MQPSRTEKVVKDPWTQRRWGPAVLLAAGAICSSYEVLNWLLEAKRERAVAFLPNVARRSTTELMAWAGIGADHQSRGMHLQCSSALGAGTVLSRSAQQNHVHNQALPHRADGNGAPRLADGRGGARDAGQGGGGCSGGAAAAVVGLPDQ